MIIKKLTNIVSCFWYRRSDAAFTTYLQKKGVRIDNNCVFRDILSIRIDISRPSLVTIGNNVSMNKDFELLTHDWVSGIFIQKYSDFIPAHKRVEIGDNVRFGTKCIVLSGTKIGDNCFIGAGSIVNKEIPANSIAAGIPAKVICSIDEYYEKRKKQYIDEALEYACSIQERFGRKPVLEDFTDDYPVFVDGSNIDDYPMMPYSTVLKGEHFEKWKQDHKAPFKNFEEFLEAAGIK